MMHDARALDILLMVHILFLISVASLIVLIGATIAIVHHIRVNRRLNRSSEVPPEPSFSDHLESAAQYGDASRSPRIVPSQSVQSIRSKKDWAPAAAQDSEATSSESQTPGHRSGPHLIRRSSGDMECQSSGDHFQISSAPRLLVVAGNRKTSSNL